MRLASSLLLAALACASPTHGAKSHLELGAEARAAQARKDFAAAQSAAQAALALRPDSPRYLHQLADLAALTGDAPAALRYLHRLADLGVDRPIERDPDLALLQGTPPFLQVLQRFEANRAPQGEAEVLAEFPAFGGILEGLAVHPRTRELFLGDVHGRCIWRCDRAGPPTRFSAEDEELLGIFGLAIDEPRNSLWAAMSAVPEMAGFTADLRGTAGLAEFNLATSELRRVVPVPPDGRDHGLGDLLVDDDGTVYATDAKAPVIWKLARGAEELEILVDSPAFSSLQGLVRWRRELIVADYSHGLFAVDLTTREIRAFAPPAGTTLLGLDGLVAVPDGIVATQNGIEPQRIVKISFTPQAAEIAGVSVLAAALPHLQDLSLIALVDARPTFIASSGWEGFDPAAALQPAPRTVRLLQVSLP
jgi:sugar lactone lactonase YvrE